MLTSGQIREALVGSELGGDFSLHYDASYAVRNDIWGQAGTGNNSGVTFGVVQLDIANNEFAKSMWKEVLKTNRDLITEDQFIEFVSYIDNKSKRSNCLSRGHLSVVFSVPEHCIEDGEELSCAGC